MIPVVNLVVFFSSEVLLLLLLLSRLICFRVYLRLGEREREEGVYNKLEHEDTEVFKRR